MIKLKIKGKILLMIIGNIIILSVLILVITFFQARKMIESHFEKQLDSTGNLALSLIDKTYQGDWKESEGKLYKGNQLINGDTELVDKIREYTGNHFTIFLKDIRVTTTVTSEGKRAIGTKASQNIIDQVLNGGKEYTGEAEVLNLPYEVKYVPIKDNNGKSIGMFFVGIEKSKADQQINLMLSYIALSTLGLILISTLIVLKIIKSIVNPLKYSAKYFAMVSNGDLSISLPDNELQRHDEIGDLSRAIKKMQESVREIISGIRHVSEQVNNQAQNLSSISQEMAYSSESVSVAVSDMAKGTDEQSQDLIGVLQGLSLFGDTLEETGRAIYETDEMSRNINLMATDSSQKMKNLTQLFENIIDSFKNFEFKIKNLGNDINKINEITIFINSIADQTNLLALNAAIEASRAGESGKGFEVVAEEIRKLAEQSKTSSESINKLIASIAGETSLIMGSSDNISKDLNEQVNVINNAVYSFEKIVEEVDKIIPKIRSVTNSSVKINDEKNSLMQKVEEVVSISQEIASSTEEVSASSEEMSSSSEEVADASERLVNETNGMIEKINKFKL
ncbi:methyl-accepting chemotaxis protein [Clostridium sp. PL3]|uniref:Methyl-accepting chemotaxis protein n=1 Tax=Clostridium thailandense TaxID=2794346 RepID=A0A949X4H4_9CLOT|nr:methyl-accepting chemotaxis protein [Clostridium thailandense]MBV7276499.1 methyl-accepting chemotaxis protein [Clostridium thailandense]